MENEPRPDAASAALPEPIDWETLNALREYQAEGEPDLVQELIGMFRAEAPALLADIRTAIAAGEADKLRHAAHTLKGSSNNLGVRQVAALSEALEKKARNGILENAEALLAQLEREFERARRALDAGQRGQG